MKKILILAAVSVFGFISVAQAQTANATLNVVLEPLLSIAVQNGNGGSATDVKLVYDSRQKYNDGVTENIVDHLKVSSAHAYQVKVKALGDLQNVSSSDVIALGATEGISLKATAGTGTTRLTSAGNVSLSTSEQTLISGPAVFDGLINVAYKGKGRNAYLTKYKQDGGTTYTTTLTYTITVN